MELAWNLHEFVLCFVEARLCFIVLVHLSCVTYVPCATMTWRGGGGGDGTVCHAMVCVGGGLALVSPVPAVPP